MHEDRNLVTYVRVGHPPGRWWKWDLQNTKRNYHLLKVCIRVLCLRMLLIISVNEHIYW
jgi:hypothetical protein